MTVPHGAVTGIGWETFALGPPANAESADEYCVGTLVPRYHILWPDEEKQNAATVRTRNLAIAKLRDISVGTMRQQLDELRTASRSE